MGHYSPTVGDTSIREFRIARCERCGLARTLPPPYLDELSADINQAWAIENVVKNPSLWRSFLAPLIDTAKRHKPKGRFLDIGCGLGLSLQMATEAGYEASGVEINQRAAHYGRDTLGLNIFPGDLVSANLPSNHFDVVMMSHVLEHIASPSAIMSEIGRILKPDGILVIETPNMNGLMARLLGSKWTGWLPDAHVWAFTPDTLRSALARYGFKVIESRQKHNMRLGMPRTIIKRLVRLTLFEFLLRATELTNNADKVLVVATAE